MSGTRNEKAGVHGREHSPIGADPTYTGEWVEVDSGLIIPGTGWYTDADVLVQRIAPALEVPWFNIGGGYVPSRFRISVGPMNMVDRTGTLVEHYAQKQLEFQIAVDGGAEGDVVWYMPPEFLIDTDYSIPLTGHNIVGVPRAFHLDPDGAVVAGASL